jgi:hypothetical protein
MMRHYFKVANVIFESLSKKYIPESIPRGELSQESKQLLRQIQQSKAESAKPTQTEAKSEAATSQSAEEPKFVGSKIEDGDFIVSLTRSHITFSCSVRLIAGL